VQKRLTWIFDLDNTLHDARPHIMPHINRSMTRYVQGQLSVSEEEAAALRQAYWRRYGATLVGMVRLHGTDAVHFLRETHRFPRLERMVVAEGGLRQALKRIPGPKLIYSNAPLHYAEQVLKILGVGAFFRALYCIERTRFQPKPAPQGFRLMLKMERLVPSRCVLVDDMLDNLRAAKRLRMKTVWISRESRAPGWVDIRLASVLLLPKVADRLTR
jgi:putative hydrolase of the HAD superfamily